MKKFFILLVCLISDPKGISDAVNTASDVEEFDRMVLARFSNESK